MHAAFCRAIALAIVFLLSAGGSPCRGADARVIPMQQYTIYEGLSHSMVYCVTQDRWGFIWIGTEDGLNRFDGREFVSYHRGTVAGEGPTDQRIMCLLPLPNGDLLIGTYSGGLNLYRAADATFTLVTLADGSPLIPDQKQINCLARQDDGIVWIGTSDGLYRYAPDGKVAEIFHNIPADQGSISHDTILSLLPDREGGLWVGTNDGLNLLKAGGASFERFSLPERADATTMQFRVRSLWQDVSGAIWVGTSVQGLFRFNGDSRSFTPIPLFEGDRNVLDDATITTIGQDSQGTLWVGTYGHGLVAYQPETGEQLSVQRDPSRTDSLANNRVWHVFSDRSGCTWVSTHTGLNKINPTWKSISLYRNIADNPDSLPHNRVWTFHEGGHPHIWIATEKGLVAFDTAQGRFKPVILSGERISTQQQPLVRAIVKGLDNDIWLGTDRDGLLRVNAEGRVLDQFRNQTGRLNGIANDSIFSLLLDRRGTLWIGTFGGGLSRLERGSKQFVRYRNLAGSPRSLSHNIVWCLFEDREGTIWIGTYDGLNRYEPESDDFSVHHFRDKHQADLTSNSIFAIAQDRDGGLWIGTDGAGLIYFDHEKGAHYRYQFPARVPARTVYGILNSGTMDLWLSTSRGLVLAARSSGPPMQRVPTMRFFIFSREDGLQDEDFNLGASMRTATGDLYFGGPGGFNVISPGLTLDVVPQKPTVLVRDIAINQKRVLPGHSVDGRVLLTAPVWETSHLVLDTQQNYINVSFACLDFLNPRMNRISYRMEGFMQEWTEIESGSDTDFILAPGDYSLQVRGANARGNWGTDEVRLAITVLPPLSETWWFRTLLVLLVIGVIAAGFSLRTRVLHRRAQELEAVNVRLRDENQARRAAEEELRHMQSLLERKVEESIKLAEDLEAFDYSVSNAIRVPLRISAGFADLLEASCAKALEGEPLHYLRTMRAHIDDAQQLVDDLLILSRASREELRREPVNLSMLARSAADRALRSFNSAMPHIRIAEGVTCRGDYRFLQILLNILIKNAVKYSADAPAPLVIFGANCVDGKTEYFVQDNGIGFEPERAERIFIPFHSYHTDIRFGGQGLGLATAQRIVERHGGHIRAEGRPGSGATFSFTLGDIPEFRE